MTTRLCYAPAVQAVRGISPQAAGCGYFVNSANAPFQSSGGGSF